MSKAALVHTNDPRAPELKLSIAGKVEEVVTIKPPRIVLQGIAGQSLTQSLIIMPRKEYPFRIVETSTGKNKNFRNVGGGSYLAVIEIEEVTESLGYQTGGPKQTKKIYIGVLTHIE